MCGCRENVSVRRSGREGREEEGRAERDVGRVGREAGIDVCRCVYDIYMYVHVACGQ